MLIVRMKLDDKFEHKWRKVIGRWEHCINGALPFILLSSNIIRVMQYGGICWVVRAACMAEVGDAICDLVGLS